MTQNTVYDIMESEGCTDETAVQLLHKAKDQIEATEANHNTKKAAHDKKWQPWIKFFEDIFNIAFWFNIVYCIAGIILNANYSIVPPIIIGSVMLLSITVRIIEYVQGSLIDTEYLNAWTENYKTWKLCWAYYRYSLQKSQLRAVLDVTRRRQLNPAEVEYLEKFLVEQ